MKHISLSAVLLLMLALLSSAVGAQDDIVNELSRNTITLQNPFNGQPLTVTLLRTLYIIAGAVLLFAGWSAHRLALSMAGFVLGMSFGAALAANFPPLVALIFSIITGAVGALLATFVYYMAVALMGGYIGLLVVGQLLNSVLMYTGGDAWLYYLVGFILGAIVAVLISTEFTMILTAGIGAVMLGNGLNFNMQPWGMLGIVGLFALGLIVQFGISKRVRPA